MSSLQAMERALAPPLDQGNQEKQALQGNHLPLPAVGSLVTGSLGSLGSLVTPKQIEDLWGDDGFGGFLNCPIPEHEGSDSMLRAPDGDLVLRCGCHATPHHWSLAEVHASRAYREAKFRLSNIELAIWWRRLAYDLRLVEPVEVTFRELPANAPQDLHRVRNGFALLVGLRRLDHEPRPVPFSIRFAAAWCGVPIRTASAAIRALREQEVIVEADRVGLIRLYEPGDEHNPPSGQELPTAGEVEAVAREHGLLVDHVGWVSRSDAA